MLDAVNIKQATLIILAGSLCAALFFSMFTNTSIGMILAYMTPYPFLMLGYTTGIGTVLVTALLANLTVYLFSTGQLAIYFLLLLVIPSLIIVYIQEQDSESFINKIGKTILTLSIYFILITIAYNYLLYFQNSSLEIAVMSLKTELLTSLENLKQLNADNHIILQAMIHLYFKYLSAFSVISILMIFSLNWALAYYTVKKFVKTVPTPGEISAINFPLWIFIAFIGASVSFFYPSTKISFILQNITLIFAFLYLIKGVAFAHLFLNSKTKKLKLLMYILFYIILLLSSWFSLLIIILGVIDHLFHIRKYIDYKIQI